MTYIRRLNKYILEYSKMRTKLTLNNNYFSFFFLQDILRYISVFWDALLFQKGMEGIDYQSEYFSIIHPLSDAYIQEHKRIQKYK